MSAFTSCQEAAKNVTEAPSLPAKRGGSGGYDCEFVEPPPEALQSDCPVCLSILRDPHQVTCCGYSFCRTCIEDIKPCPTCNAEDFSIFADKRLQRSLNSFKVHCPHKDDGCEWTGELGELGRHLNESPSNASDRARGCQYLKFECTHCTKSYQRKLFDAHLNCCPQRPYCCDYCRDYKASFNDVVNKHYPVCKCYPLRCPNKCDELQEGFKYMIERQNLEHHLKEECILRPVECDFHYAGCGVKLPRKDMLNHLAGSLVAHMSLLAAHGKKTAADAQKTAVDLQKALEEKDKQISELRKDTHQMQERVQKLEMENKALKERADLKFDRLHSHLHTPPLTFTMTNFEQHKREKTTWVSPPFFSHPHGYKLCITVTAMNTVLSSGYISVQACLMRGEFDNCLQWPFQSDVYIRILNQLSDDNHVNFVGSFSAGPTAKEAGSRVMTGERRQTGRPINIPITLESLDGDSSTQQYLKDDCIHIQVARVTNSVQFYQLEQQFLAIDHQSICKPPVELTMNDFEQHKREGSIWRSPSFYTHSQGYRMSLHVIANGYGRGKDSNLFIATVIMRGQFDAQLEWPFQGVVNIQLLNQLEDKQHHSDFIRYDVYNVAIDGRVTCGEMSLRRGHNSITYSQLGFNQARNCQYLKEDSLIFRITEVELNE